MSFSLTQLAIITIIYLMTLFIIALSSEKGWVPKKLMANPIIYTLAMAIPFSAWTFYGVVDLAYQYGYGALAFYLGTGALFFFAPIAMVPLVELADRFKIRSIADLMVFRFHSQATGSLTTLFMLSAALPMMALQFQAVADTIKILSPHPDVGNMLLGLPYRDTAALVYCAALALFTILFGQSRQRQKGLLLAMAFESLLKVTALFTIGLFAVHEVFGGLGGLDQWLADHPDTFAMLQKPINEGAAHTLLLVFLASAVTMPLLLQMTGEGLKTREIAAKLSWSFPLFLLFMALPVFPILWAGMELQVPLPVQYFSIGVPMMMESTSLTILAFIGGLSAATGATIVIVINLATMILNHWALPITTIRQNDIYGQISRLRSILIIVLFFCGFAFYKLINNNLSLTELAFLYFIGILQFLPGTFSTTYWPMINSRGFITGLMLGSSIWFIGLLLPSITSLYALPIPFSDMSIPLGIDYWQYITPLSLTFNLLAMALTSMFTHTSKEEKYSAELCTEDELSHPLRMILETHNVQDFVDRLAESLGTNTALQEVNRALADLNLSLLERRPYALRKLRNRLEINLSGLMGTSMATELLNKHIPYMLPEGKGSSDIHLIESRLIQYRTQLSGLAVELDNLRIFHRNTLEELPMATCSIGTDQEIMMWNHAMEALTRISSDTIIGSHLNSLKEPWRTLLHNFSSSLETHNHKQEVDVRDQKRWVSLHKANVSAPVSNISDGIVILIEDITDIVRLEQELMHNERLASIGRLAAGVAHEIGNPVTGIACLAQNLKHETEIDEIHDIGDQVLGQTDRITRIVQSLVTFAHTGKQDGQYDFETIYIYECASEAILLLQLSRDQKQINFVNQIDSDLTVKGDSQRIIQVFINLLSNARDASPNNSNVTLTSHTTKQHTVLQITDTGSGISIDQKGQVFEPFFTSKEPGDGTGLGLAMVYSIIDEHKGHIEIDSPPAGKPSGTCFTIKLPL